VQTFLQTFWLRQIQSSTKSSKADCILPHPLFPLYVG